MRHVIISDTHAPTTVEAIYSHLKRMLPRIHPDAIVINGDLLGIFSMERSTVHETYPSNEEKLEYLRLAAPKFLKSYQESGKLTPELALAYVRERYEWCFGILEKFAALKHTIFNLGNHESKEHFLVLQELPFLIGEHAPRLPDEELEKIYVGFELHLAALELEGSFTYIRNRPILIDSTLILGIPGESHGTVGPDPKSQTQEAKTRLLIKRCAPLLSQAERIIIYNHTQGDYNRESETFQPASPSLQQFMRSLPENITQRIFVQSHNHWKYTQFLVGDQFHFILNNAGLHAGIYNLLDCDEDVSVVHLDPAKEKGTMVESRVQ